MTRRPAGPAAPSEDGTRLQPENRLTDLQRSAGNQAVAGAVQRKELGTAGQIVKRVTGLGLKLPGDWYEADRLAMNLPGGLTATNGFVVAAKYNTLLNKPGEYGSISERNDYYKALDWLLHNDATFASTTAAQSIKFFAAAATVTGYNGIGGLELLALGVPIPPNLNKLVHAVNKKLFEMNMKVLSRIGAATDVVDPKAVIPGKPADAFEFDLRMVEAEQGEVQTVLAGPLGAAMTSVETTLLNLLVNMNIQHGGKDPKYMEWAKLVFSVTDLDFMKQEHRMAIGRAMVHIAHGKSYKDFETYITTGSPRYASTPIVRP